jgi:hypothetical protein
MKIMLNAAAVLAAMAVGTAAGATNLVTNGDFELTTLAGSAEFGARYPSNQLTGWTTDGYNFVFASGAADDGTGAAGEYNDLQLWGPGNGANNGLPASSPTGGNYVGADGAFGVGAISQTINGLIAGHKYDVSFWWAGAQQYGFNGANTEQWQVSFGNESQSTGVLSNADHGFTGWRQETFTFTATNSSQVLSFLAHGTPEGVPPFSLLDGVSLEAQGAVPEPASWALMILGFGASGVAMRRRKISFGLAG